MKTTYTSPGFTIVEGIIIFIVVGLVAVLGLTFYNTATKQTASTTAPVTTQSTAETIKATPVPAVNTTTDLDKATTDLNSLDLTDSQDATQLDQQESGF